VMMSCQEERRLSRIAGADTGERQTAQRALVAICVSLVSLHVVSWRLSSWMRLACPASSLDQTVAKSEIAEASRGERRSFFFFCFPPWNLERYLLAASLRVTSSFR
jgi:hypothetical protein